jgi:hypothetical protein
MFQINIGARRAVAAFAAVSALALAPSAALACACGCGIFDVGDGTFMPNNADSGLAVWFRLAYMDQNQNWEGDHGAPASDNGDKQINTTFYFFGGQYMINRDWSVMVELPVFDRALTTTDDGTVFGPAGTVYTGHDFNVGDVELMGMYTGFSKDMSTGVGVGVKLPTGDWHGPNGPLGGAEFDRDSLPGTGSTDLIVQGYHVGSLNKSGSLGYFVQAKYQAAVASQGQYRPGDEFDSALGVTYDLGSVGPLTRVAPVLQLLNSYRQHDTGANADPLNSGYERVLIDPGVSVRIKKLRLDADVAIPLYQHTNAAPNVEIEGTSGQLVAKTLLKFQATYDF